MPRQNSWPLTLVVAALGVTATLVFWQASERGLREATDRTIERVTIEVKNEIAARIEAHNRALERLALRWIHQQGTPNDLWDMDVQGYLEDFPGHQAIEWVDSDFRVRWIVPLKGNEAAQGLDLGFEPRRRRAMERARDKRSTTMTRPIDLVQGGRGMLTYVPLYSEDKFDGFMLGVYRIESLFGHVLSSDRIARGYGIEVSIDGETVFERPTSAAQHGRKWTRGSALTLYSVPFELSVWPSDATLVRMRSELPWLVLFSGLAVTALITGISHLGRIVWARSLQLERTNREIREHSAQRELAQAELSRHDLAIAGAFDGIAILDPDGCYNYMNHAYARIYGYDDPEDLIGMRWQTLYFPEEVQAIEDKAFPALAEHRRWHSELTGKRADGERFDVEVSLTSLDDGGMVCVCRDITARKTAEHAVRESEQRLQGILDNTSAVVYMKDLHGRYMLINQRFERLFGVTRDHVRGKTDHDLFQTEVADAFRANDIAVAEKGDVLQIEETAPHDDGLHTYVSIKFPMRDTAGFTYAVAGISTDITDLKRAEIALRESEQRFELAVRGSQDGLWDWLDVTGDQVWWSPRFYELLGYEPGEIPAGMAAFKDLLHPDDLDETMRAVREHFQQNVRYDIEYRLRCKDGRHRWFRARGATVRDESGKPLRMAGSIQDVHERKLAQNELQRSARQLEESNRELENFVYTVSHDLKSPLVTFMGFLSHLKSDVEQGRTDKLIEYSAYMQRAAVRMKNIINDLLEISRIGRAEYQQETIDVPGLVRSVVADLSDRIKALGVTVLIDETTPPIDLDRTRLRQVFDNLLNNALKYGVGADTPTIHVGGRTTGEQIQYYVADNGPGIDPRYHNKIFGVFQRLHTDEDGTGVGLAIVSRVAEVYGGRAWVESELGKGATFWVAFPRETIGRVRGPATPPACPPTREAING